MNPHASSQPIGQSSKAVSVRTTIEQTETATSSCWGIWWSPGSVSAFCGDRFGNCHFIHEKIRW
jgi:hypothetical protein